MKILAIIIIMGHSMAHADDETSRAEKALYDYRSQQTTNEIIEHLRAIEIRTAYPDDPAMWRYLERNPRYQPYYLGH